MKKIVALLLALFLVLLPQSALAMQGSQNLRQPVCAPEAVPVRTEDMEAIESLLVGVPYENKKVDVLAWSDEERANVIYAKLLDDYFRDGAATNLESIGMAYRTDDMGTNYVDLALIQRITQETFGLDFPSDVSLNWIYVVGDEVAFEMASGEGAEMSVQECVRVGDTVLAVGTSVYHYGVGSAFEGHFLATLQAAPDTVYGYRLISLEPVEDAKTLRYLTAEASSELAETKTTHRAANVLDNDLTTAWCESVKGVGVNEWILLRSTDGSKMHISAIEFLLGFHKSQEHLEKNGYPWEILIEAQGDYAQKVSFDDVEDCILLNSPVETEWIKFTILDAAAGNKYEDTCITEIKLHGIDAEPCFRTGIDKLPEEEPTEPEQTEPVETEPTTEPTTEPATEPQEVETTEPTTQTQENETTEPEDTEPSKSFWDGLDKEDPEEDRRGETRKNGDNTVLLVTVIAAAVIIVALLVVLIIVVSKKKRS